MYTDFSCCSTAIPPGAVQPYMYPIHFSNPPFHSGSIHHNQPFSPLVLIPSTRYLLKNRKIKNTGSNDSVDIANMAP